jgi:hypothetical protein
VLSGDTHYFGSVLLPFTRELEIENNIRKENITREISVNKIGV